MKTELLLQTKQKILKHHRQFNMTKWYCSFLGFDWSDKTVKAEGCGTAACIAGWMWFLRASDLKTLEDARQLESLSVDILKSEEELPNGKLFYLNNWPYKFERAYTEATAKGHFKKAAIAAAEAIDNYIATNGWENRISNT